MIVEQKMTTITNSEEQVLLGRVIIAQLLETLPGSYETGRFIIFSARAPPPSSAPYPESHKYSSHSPTSFLLRFVLILSFIYPYIILGVSSRFPFRIAYAFWMFSMHTTCLTQ
jgi:hypothetical protein